MLIVCTRAKPGRRIVLAEGSIVYPEEGAAYEVHSADGYALIGTGDFKLRSLEGAFEPAERADPTNVIDIEAEGSAFETGGRAGPEPASSPEPDPDPAEGETDSLIPCSDC